MTALTLCTTVPRDQARLLPGGHRLLKVGVFLEDVGDPPPMLVSELIPDMSLILLAAKQKHLKTFEAFDIMHAVCQGRPVFGRYPVNRSGPVIYLGMEDGKYEIANRFLQRGIKPGDDLPLHICYDRFVLTEEYLAQFAEQIQEIKPVLLVIDTAREALGIKDWLNAAEITDKVRPLREFAHNHCAVLLNCHNRKMEGGNGDEISGSNAFTSAVDGWWSIYKKDVLPTGNVRLHHHREGRGGLRGDFVVEMDTDTLQFTALSDEVVQKSRQDAEPPSVQEERYTTVLRLMTDTNGKANATWITTQLPISERTAQILLKQMAEKGWIEDSGERVGQTNSTVVYQLTEAGKREARKREIDIGDTSDSSGFLGYEDPYNHEDQED